MEGHAVWALLSKEKKEPEGILSDKFILKYDRYLDWVLLSKNYDFSIELLRIYFHRVTWGSILKRKQYPESFLREMSSNFDEYAWNMVSKHQTLSEKFIGDFAEQLDWENILLYQNVTDSFLKHQYRYKLPQDVTF